MKGQSREDEKDSWTFDTDAIRCIGIDRITYILAFYKSDTWNEIPSIEPIDITLESMMAFHIFNVHFLIAKYYFHDVVDTHRNFPIDTANVITQELKLTRN